MSNGNYNRIRKLVINGRYITKEEYEDLQDLYSQLSEYTRLLTEEGDIDQALYMRNKSLEVKDVIDRACVR